MFVLFVMGALVLMSSLCSPQSISVRGEKDSLPIGSERALRKENQYRELKVLGDPQCLPVGHLPRIVREDFIKG